MRPVFSLSYGWGQPDSLSQSGCLMEEKKIKRQTTGKDPRGEVLGILPALPLRVEITQIYKNGRVEPDSFLEL